MTYTFQSKEQIKEFFSAAGSQIKRIPENRINEFLNDFVKEYLKQTNYSEEDLIPVSFWCLQVIASKPKQDFTKTDDSDYQPKLFSKL